MKSKFRYSILFTALFTFSALLGSCSHSGKAYQAATGKNPYSSNVKKKILENGLTILVKERKAAPVATVMTYVKTGFIHTDDSLSGIPHVYEHLFFKGSKKYPNREDIAQLVTGLGGSLNAWTSFEETSYFFRLPSENVEKGLEIMADSIENPVLDSNEIKKEIEVVIQEGRRRLDSPSTLAWEELKKTLFTKSRIKRWMNGEEDNLRKFDKKTISKFHKDHYTPDNMIVTVVGDVDGDKIIEKIEKLFGAMKGKSKPNTFGELEPEEGKFRFKRKTSAVSAGYLSVGFKVPPRNHPDEIILDFLPYILTNGEKSLLKYPLIENQTGVTNIGSSSQSYTKNGYFYFSLNIDPKKTAKALKSFFTVLEKVGSLEISESTLNSAKKRYFMEFMNHSENNKSIASVLSRYESWGDYRKIESDLEKVSNIKTSDIKRVLNKWFQTEHAAVLELLPEKMDYSIHHSSESEQLLSWLQDNKKLKSELLISEIKNPTDRIYNKDGKTIKSVFKYKSFPSSGLVNIGVYFKGGMSDESPKNTGITTLLQNSMLNGPEGMSKKEFLDYLAYYGVSLYTETNPDYFGFTVTTLPEDAQKIASILTEVLNKPALFKDDLEIERKKQLFDIAKRSDQSSAFIFDKLTENIFKGHPYSLPKLGKESSLKSITEKDLRKWHRDVVLSNKPVIIVSGPGSDADLKKIHHVIANKFNHQKNKSSSSFTTPSWESPIKVPDSVRRNKAQSALILGFESAPSYTKDWFNRQISVGALSGLGGRLFSVVRGTHNLAYVVHALNVGRREKGIFFVYTATAPKNLYKAKQLILKEMREISSKGFKKDEFERARNREVGNFLISNQSPYSWISTQAKFYFTGKRFIEFNDYINELKEVSYEDVNRSFRDLFKNSKLFTFTLNGTSGKKVN